MDADQRIIASTKGLQSKNVRPFVFLNCVNTGLSLIEEEYI